MGSIQSSPCHGQCRPMTRSSKPWIGILENNAMSKQLETNLRNVLNVLKPDDPFVVDVKPMDTRAMAAELQKAEGEKKSLETKQGVQLNRVKNLQKQLEEAKEAVKDTHIKLVDTEKEILNIGSEYFKAEGLPAGQAMDLEGLAEDE